jgi:hypothetical protein
MLQRAQREARTNRDIRLAATIDNRDGRQL